MRAPGISESEREQVRRRAGGLCDYCHTSEQWQYVPFTVDHIVPPGLGGSGSTDNLALTCFHCNRRKSDKVSASDPDSGDQVPLFHPRQHSWGEHFVWSADCRQIIGLTPVGRATVDALDFNRARILDIRSADHAVGRHPPAGDPVRTADEEPDASRR